VGFHTLSPRQGEQVLLRIGSSGRQKEGETIEKWGDVSPATDTRGDVANEYRRKGSEILLYGFEVHEGERKGGGGEECRGEAKEMCLN
jgi:hypothetical protein